MKPPSFGRALLLAASLAAALAAPSRAERIPSSRASAAALGDASAVPDDASAGKCGARLLERLRSASPLEPVTVWVFFSDRGPAGGAARAPAACISPRAASRRSLRGAPLRDAHDLPVCPAYIDSLRPFFVRLRHASRYFNAVSAVVRAGDVPALSSRDFVRSVDLVAVSRRAPFPETTPGEEPRGARAPGRRADVYGDSFTQLNLVGVIGLLESGYNGSGRVAGHAPVIIGVLDTGFKLVHTAFRNVHVRAQWDFVQGDSVTSNQAGDGTRQDLHGTLVLSVIGGDAEGNLIGPAWGAEFLLAKTEIDSIEVQIEEDHWVAGIEWADSAGADVVTSSLGYIDWYTRSQLDGKTALCTIAAEIAVSHGIVVVNSAGNEDGAGLIAPADGDSVLSIGAVDRYGVLAPFSSIGPTADGRLKPDFVAMGMDVQTVSYSNPDGYSRYNGTSFSAPMMAGVCALLLESHPDWSPMNVREALRATASKSGFPDNFYGYGLPNATLAASFPETFVHLSAFPNSFSDKTTVSVSLLFPGRVSVRVYDCRGALIKTLAEGSPVEKSFTIVWDGTNDRGDKVSGGVYFIRIASRGLNKTLKAVRVP